MSSNMISLKLMVNMKTKKVVFAEAAKEFADFLCSIFTMPLGTVANVLCLYDKASVGSLEPFSVSIASLKPQNFERNKDLYDVFRSRSSLNIPLLGLHHSPLDNFKIYGCVDKDHGKAISDVQGTICCGREMCALPYYFVEPKETAPGYVNGDFLVKDNLEVKPLSIALFQSLADEFDGLEEKEVQVGREEGTAIVKALLETDAVLTTVFFDKIWKE